MALSNELISELVKATNSSKNTPVNDYTVYGTVVDDGERQYVKIDGSEELTPINSTVEQRTGDRVVVTIKNHNATVMGNVTDPSASSKRLTETADGLVVRVDDVEKGFAEIKVTADEITSKVKNLEEEFTNISQTPNKVQITAHDPDKGTLTTTIDASTWEAIYKTITGEPGSGFYFDFEKGQFVFDGTGRFRNGDATTYVEIENDELVFYSKDADKIRLGFMSQPDPNNIEENVDYPYMLLGKAGDDDLGEKVGMVKKFYNGLWIGNSVPKNSFGYFSGMEKANGFFIDTVTGKSYVVNGTDMKDVYAGSADGDPTLTSEDISHQGYVLADCMPVLVTQAQYDEMVANNTYNPATPYLIRREVDG